MTLGEPSASNASRSNPEHARRRAWPICLLLAASVSSAAAGCADAPDVADEEADSAALLFAVGKWAPSGSNMDLPANAFRAGFENSSGWSSYICRAQMGEGSTVARMGKLIGGYCYVATAWREGKFPHYEVLVDPDRRLYWSNDYPANPVVAGIGETPATHICQGQVKGNDGRTDVFPGNLVNGQCRISYANLSFNAAPPFKVLGMR